MITTEELGQRCVELHKIKRQKEISIIEARTEYMMNGDLNKFAKKLREIK